MSLPVMVLSEVSDKRLLRLFGFKIELLQTVNLVLSSILGLIGFSECDSTFLFLTFNFLTRFLICPEKLNTLRWFGHLTTTFRNQMCVIWQKSIARNVMYVMHFWYHIYNKLIQLTYFRNIAPQQTIVLVHMVRNTLLQITCHYLEWCETYLQMNICDIISRWLIWSMYLQ